MHVGKVYPYAPANLLVDGRFGVACVAPRRLRLNGNNLLSGSVGTWWNSGVWLSEPCEVETSGLLYWRVENAAHPTTHLEIRATMVESIASLPGFGMAWEQTCLVFEDVTQLAKTLLTSLLPATWKEPFWGNYGRDGTQHWIDIVDALKFPDQGFFQPHHGT